LPDELLKFIDQAELTDRKNKNKEEEVVVDDPKIHYDKEDLISFH